MSVSPDIIIGVDAGTSVMKAVAFQLDGTQIAISSIKNNYKTGSDGAATQPMDRTWSDCASAILSLSDKIPNLENRTVAIAVTGQGDGTWLMDKSNQPFTDAWLWLDARAAPTVETLNKGPLERKRFETTGTGLNTCQQGSQLAHMEQFFPDLLEQAAISFHCKDGLYYCLTDVIATDPSEASFTFGDFRTRQYNEDVISALGLSGRRSLLPDILDGTKTTHPLSNDAAKKCGLKTGTPVSLGYVDMIMTALGAGIYTGEAGIACSALGSTGVHMKAVKAEAVKLGQEHTGYVLCLPHEDIVAQTQTNMAATLNLDWVLDVGADLIGQFTTKPNHKEMLEHVGGWIDAADPCALLYHPYISEAGERGPFTNPDARASFNGMSANTDYANLVRSIVEGLAMAARDCYQAMGELPREVRLTGGAARSEELRQILAASLQAPIRISSRDEAGAAGAAMMAAVAIGAFDDMHACIDVWVTPLLGRSEFANQKMIDQHDQLYDAYKECRQNMSVTWSMMAEMRRQKDEA